MEEFSPPVDEDAIIVRLEGELNVAIDEIRACLGRQAANLRLPPHLMRLTNLIDRISVKVCAFEGGGAFVYSQDNDVVGFSKDQLLNLVSSIADLAGELQMESAHATRLAINMYVVHELMHIRQNFPNFATVGVVKNGLGTTGLPLLDVAADTVAAFVCGLIESERSGANTETEKLNWYGHALIFSYALGAFVFDASSPTKRAKRQRVLGLLISAALVYAKAENRLNELIISDSWGLNTPIFALDFETCGTFEALVIDNIPSLLIGVPDVITEKEARDIWYSVGQRPVLEAFIKINRVLEKVGVLTTSPPNNAP